MAQFVLCFGPVLVLGHNLPPATSNASCVNLVLGRQTSECKAFEIIAKSQSRRGFAKQVTVKYLVLCEQILVNMDKKTKSRRKLILAWCSSRQKILRQLGSSTTMHKATTTRGHSHNPKKVTFKRAQHTPDNAFWRKGRHMGPQNTPLISSQL